jgi:hypothetical protein
VPTWPCDGSGREAGIAEVRDGRIRCPVCHRWVALTPSGRLRLHGDRVDQVEYDRRMARATRDAANRLEGFLRKPPQ